MKNRTLTGATALITAFCISSAKADNYAYMSDRAGDFGSVDLNTGSFTLIGDSGLTFTGMAAENGTLYGGRYQTGDLYSINPATGSPTLVGTSAESYELFGSTPSGLFALGTDNNLYSINPATGAATLVGPTGTTLTGSWFGMSTGSSSLYYSDGPDLYSLNTSIGLATLVGNMGGPQIGAMLEEGGVLYGGQDSGPTSVDTIDPTTGIATTGPALTGAPGNFWALAPDPLPSTAPDAASTMGLLSAASIGSFLARRRLLPA